MLEGVAVPYQVHYPVVLLASFLVLLQAIFPSSQGPVLAHQFMSLRKNFPVHPYIFKVVSDYLPVSLTLKPYPNKGHLVPSSNSPSNIF